MTTANPYTKSGTDYSPTLAGIWQRGYDSDKTGESCPPYTSLRSNLAWAQGVARKKRDKTSETA